MLSPIIEKCVTKFLKRELNDANGSRMRFRDLIARQARRVSLVSTSLILMAIAKNKGKPSRRALNRTLHIRAENFMRPQSRSRFDDLHSSSSSFFTFLARECKALCSHLASRHSSPPVEQSRTVLFTSNSRERARNPFLHVVPAQ